MRLDEKIVPDVTPADRPAPRRRVGRHAARRPRGVAAAIALAVGATVVGGVVLADDVRRTASVIAADEPMIASEKSVLADLWRDYKEIYLEEATGRTMDLQDGTVTTSEGQGYTMLRAVWMDDQETFARSWQWTKDNLQRDDSLLAGRFGERVDGSYGIQDDLGGAISATDADVDIAFALLMAYSRWQQDDYLYDAVPIIEAIWERSVLPVEGEPVLMADDLQGRNGDQVLLNPSYFAPYAYRVFAAVDPEHDWAGVVDSSYALLERLVAEPLEAGSTVGLPPERVRVDRRTGEFIAVTGDLSTRYSTDALRLPWRLALDHAWYGDERALRLLEEHAFLADAYLEHGRLVGAYYRDGTPAADYETPAMYGGAMGFFDTVRPELADEVYTEELLPLYDLDTGDLAERLSYHDSNWVWFGMALHFDELPNLNVTPEE